MELKLISNDGISTSLYMHEEDLSYQIESILNSTEKVYADKYYHAEVVDSNMNQIKQAFISINGDDVVSYYQDSTIRFQTRLFKDILGYVQITLKIVYMDGRQKEFYSDFASVMVQEDIHGENINLMLKYIYDNSIEFLYTSSRENQVSDPVRDKSFNDLLSRISMVEEIATVYENSYGFFKANSRFKLKSVYSVDRIEKLQEIGARTIQYMVQHPEYMRREYTGIRYGRQSYLPDKTLMSINQVTTDIYENRIVVAFLGVAYNDTLMIKKHINNYLKLVSREEKEGGYILSSYLIFMNTISKLKEAESRLDVLCAKLRSLQFQYKQAIHVSDIDCSYPPEPTQVFLSVPQYNKLFICIMNWFNKNGYDFSTQRLMVNFYNSSVIYEFYVLLKLIKSIQQFGFDLFSTKRVEYPVKVFNSKNKHYYNNIFEFKKDSATITLFYEPAILDSDRRDIANLELYRKFCFTP